MPIPETGDFTSTDLVLDISWNNNFLILTNMRDMPITVEDFDGLTFVAPDDTTFAATSWGLTEDVGRNQCVSIYMDGMANLASDSGRIPHPSCDFQIRWIQINNEDMFWATEYETFDMQSDGNRIATCVPRKGVCYVPHTPDNLHAAPTNMNLAQVEVYWNAKIFVLLNPGPRGADVSKLRFELEGHGFGARNWRMEYIRDITYFDLMDMRPGACLVAYPYDDQPELPDTVECTRIIGRSILTSPQDAVWTEELFQAFVPDSDSQTCTGVDCVVYVPAANE